MTTFRIKSIQLTSVFVQISLYLLKQHSCVYVIVMWIILQRDENMLKIVMTPQTYLMPQSHHTPGPGRGCSRAVPGRFWTKIVRPFTGPARAPCGAVRILPLRTGPVEFNACIIRLRAPYGLWYPKQPVNSTCGDRKGVIRPNHKTCQAVRGRSMMWAREQQRRKDSYGRVTWPYGQQIVRVIKIVRGPWLDVTEALLVIHETSDESEL